MNESVKYAISVSFALVVFGACFYGIVLYEYNLDDLKTGALISLMTLAANFVFADAVGSAVGRRAQKSFETGLSASSPTTTTTVTPPATTTTTTAPPAPPEET